MSDGAAGSDTVLLVDDDEGVRTFTALVLRRAGYHVLEAGDGPEAVRLAEQHTGPIRLLIVDIVLPHLSGRAVAIGVLSRRPDTRVLYSSGYGGHIPDASRLEPGDVLLEKPFTPRMLLDKIDEALRA